MRLKIVFIILLFPSLVFSAVTSYNAGTIGGASFGEKPLPDAQIRSDDFEDGVSGNVIADTTTWTDYHALQNTLTEPPKYSNLNQRTSDSLLNSRFFWDIDKTLNPSTEFADSFLIEQLPAQQTGKMFMSWWIRYDKGTGGDDRMQHKIFRLTKGDTDTTAAVFLYAWEDDVLADVVYFTIRDGDGSVIVPDELKTTVGLTFTQDKWTQLQVWITGGTSGNITVRYMPEDKTPVTLTKDMSTLVAGQYWEWITAGYYHGNSDFDATAEWFYDDIYYDNSFYQVVVGDNSSYNACTVLNLQDIVSWSDTEIVTTPNPSGMVSGYLFPVVDGIPQEPGYLISFADETTVTLQVDFSTETSPTTYTGSATAIDGQTLTGAVSSNGYTVTPDDGVWDEQTEAFTVSGVIPTVTDTVTATASDASTGFDSITVTLTPTQSGRQVISGFGKPRWGAN